MKLSSLTRNARAMREGEWISPGVEYGDLEICLKAIGGKYADERAAKMKFAARRAGGMDKIGFEIQNKIDIETLIETCLIDVRGLEHEDGTPVTLAEFRDLLQLPESRELATITFTCAGLVGQKLEAQKEEAAGN